jgi:hypothetical protein
MLTKVFRSKKFFELFGESPGRENECENKTISYPVSYITVDCENVQKLSSESENIAENLDCMRFKTFSLKIESNSDSLSDSYRHR